MSTIESGGTDGLAARIASFVESWGDVGEFNDLALELFAHQYQQCAPYRRFCDGRGASPSSVRLWREIPAVPAEAFRTQTLACSMDAPAAVFHTSGTTSAGAGRDSPRNPGQHLMDDAALALYRLSLNTTFTRLAVRAVGLPIRALLAPYSQAPHSSLSFMVSSIGIAMEAQQGSSDDAVRYFWKDDGPDIAEARFSLPRGRNPILLFTTAFALLEMLESLDGTLTLRVGSVVIETGGFKGRRRLVEREELYRRASDRLGVPLDNIGSEYGMCEMASQFYDQHLGSTSEGLAANYQGPASIGGPTLPAAIKVGPPWVRTVVLDPATGERANAGQPGILRHYDLCNLNSVAAIQTMDVGVASENGEGFVLQGRLTGTTPRGCSLTVEDWLERQ